MDRKFSVMRIIGDRAVLQSGCVNTVYGYAPAGQTVSLLITGCGSRTELSADADADGKWKTDIPPFEGSCGAYTFTFSCEKRTVRFVDIYFGELFHISGQSNMELPMYRTVDPLTPEDMPVCEYIREFRVPVRSCFGKDEVYEDLQGGQWLTANKDNVPEMSAAGFWFALELYRKYKVPVGLLNTSAGGAPTEARMPYDMLSELGWYDDFLAECTEPGYVENTTAADMLQNTERNSEIERLDNISDKVLSGEAVFTDCTVPFDFRDVPELCGICGRIWFRRKFEIPDDAELSDALLMLGTLTDADRTYLNGVLVGETGYMYPPRFYPVSESIIKHGTNTLLVCLDVRYGCGGFTKGKTYCLKLKDRLIDLSGEWGYVTAAKVPIMKRETFFQGLPLSMYGAMTAPVFRIKCRALIWYQGESNCNHPDRYAFLFEKFVEMYREKCGYDIPVITTQLCNFNDPFAGDSDCWAELRDAQLKCLDIPGTDMAVTIDIGESSDLHPMNKKDVGKRLARCAVRTVYNDKSVPPDVLCTGASYLGSGRILLSFSDNSRVRVTDNSGTGFDICTENDVFPALSAEMSRDGLLVTYASSDIPAKVRCEWRNDPAVVLYDTEGVPLSPFGINVTVGDVK